MSIEKSPRIPNQEFSDKEKEPKDRAKEKISRRAFIKKLGQAAIGTAVMLELPSLGGEKGKSEAEEIKVQIPEHLETLDEVLDFLYEQINKAIEFILEQKGDNEYDRWAYAVDKSDLYHVHVCVVRTNETDKTVRLDELRNGFTLLFHSKEDAGIQSRLGVPAEYQHTKRNIIFDGQTWSAQDDLLDEKGHKRGIGAEDLGWKDFSIYFAKDRESFKKVCLHLKMNPQSIKNVDQYYFGLAERDLPKF